MTDFVERRRYFRMNVNCNISYCLLGSDEIHTGRCYTLSGAGISFTTSQELTLNTELELTIQTQLSLTPPLRAHAQVVRVRILEDGLFEIGASMTVLHNTFPPSDDSLISCL